MNEVALFENALRAAVPSQPDRTVGSDLVRRLASVARSATLEIETQATRGAARVPAWRRSRLALVARVAIAVALIPLALAGLAVAGVNLPQPARDAFDSLGVNLPNQASDQAEKATQKSTPATPGNDVSDAAKSGPSSEQGNSGAAHQHAREQRNKAVGKGKKVGHTRGKAIGLNEGTPPGHDGSAGNSGNAGPPAHSNSSNGSAGSAPSSRSSGGGGPSHPFPTQAHGQALGRSKERSRRRLALSPRTTRSRRSRACRRASRSRSSARRRSTRSA